MAGRTVARPVALLLAAVAFVVMPTALSEADAYKLGLVLIVFVGAAGLHVLVNWAGELSLGHAAVVGAPAFLVATMSADHGISPIVLLPLGVLAGAVLGAVLGLPALRARDLQVALVTLAGAIAVDRYFFTKEWFAGPAAGARVADPSLGFVTFHTARSLYPVLAVVVVLTIGAVWMLYHSKVARGMLWVSADRDAAGAFGIPTARYRVLAYAVAGAFAGLAGGLTAMWVQRLTPSQFPVRLGFTYLIIVALAGPGLLAGVAIAALFVEGGRLFLPGADALILYGAPIGLILVLTRYRGGINGALRQAGARLRRNARAPARGEPDVTAPAVPLRRPAEPHTLLEVRDARVSFGGLQALDGVSLRVDEGQVVGLIGPNGAGKTTLFDAITGHRRLDSGRVLFDGHDVTRLRPHARARLGMGRSFQNLGLMVHETAERNVRAAQFLSAGYSGLDVLLRPWRWRAGERRMADRGRRALAELGVQHDRDRHVDDLQFAGARLVELAAVLVEHPRLVLLDEPTTGLDVGEIATLGRMIDDLRTQGTTVVVIAHDVGFVMQACDAVYVLTEGHVLTSGTPDAVQRDPAVVEAYLGTTRTTAVGA